MNISMIVAMGRNNVIGKNNKIPWKLPAEQQYFKEVTMGHPVVSGRRNFESMGRPLKGRRNIILTRNNKYEVENCEVISSIQELADKFGSSEEEIFIIGGEEIYRLFLPLAKKLYITTIEADFEGDTYFPTFANDEWNLVLEKAGVTDERNLYNYTYRIYERM